MRDEGLEVLHKEAWGYRCSNAHPRLRAQTQIEALYRQVINEPGEAARLEQQRGEAKRVIVNPPTRDRECKAMSTTSADEVDGRGSTSSLWKRSHRLVDGHHS